MTKGKSPNRTISFKTPRAPAAEIYEQTKGRQTMQVDLRNKGVRHLALCAVKDKCTLLQQALNMELQTDALLAPTAQEMLRRRH